MSQLIAFSEKLQDHVVVKYDRASEADRQKIENAAEILEEGGGQVLVISNLLKYYKATQTWKLGEFLEEIARDNCEIEIHDD